MCGPPSLPPDDQFELTPSHSGGQEEEKGGDDKPYGPAPTQVIMITDDTFPFSTTAESYYAKEDMESMQVGGDESSFPGAASATSAALLPKHALLLSWA